jgi:serine/threonine-protein kinase
MEEMNLLNGDYDVIIDIGQPGTEQQEGVYHTGKVVGRVETRDWKEKSPLPDGTLLYGQLWTEGLTKYGNEAVLGRYTEALLPDGRRLPICFILWDHTGLLTKREGSKPGAARLPRRVEMMAVRRWP